MAFLLLQSGKIVNIYLDLIIGALVESVSYVILYFLVRTVYRKPLIFTLSGALAFLIMVALIFRAFGTGLSGTRFTSEIILNVRFSFLRMTKMTKIREYVCLTFKTYTK